MRFFDRWSMAYTQGAIGFPRHSHQVLFSKSIGKRSSLCHVCSDTIVVGEERAEVLVRTPFRVFPRGGGSSGCVCYAHIRCMIGFFGTSEPSIICHSCKIPLDPGVYSRLRLSGATLVRLCASCTLLPMYRKCDSCGVFLLKNQTSRVVVSQNSDDRFWKAMNAGEYVCTFCEKDDFVETERSVRATEKFFREVSIKGAEVETWVRESR